MRDILAEFYMKKLFYSLALKECLHAKYEVVWKYT
jgi:hypothetical protein